MGLGFVIARWFLKLDRGGDAPVKAADKKVAFRHQHDTAKITAEHGAGWRAQPAEPAAIHNRGFSRVAQVFKVFVRNFQKRLYGRLYINH
jgi:hypothetical protein